MLSVIIATDRSEQIVVPTLAALVPGATAGIVSEVILADAGSDDGTARVADVAGCRYIASSESLGARLGAAAREARAPWLLFLRPGVVPDATWIDETRRFIEDAELRQQSDMRAAVFRPTQAAGSPRALLSEAFTLLRAALGIGMRPDQPLLIAKRLYDTMGGHDAERSDPEADFLRRLGRRRMAMLRCGGVSVARPAAGRGR